MGNETAIVNFYIKRKNGLTDCVDLEIPLYVSANTNITKSFLAELDQSILQKG